MNQADTVHSKPPDCPKTSRVRDKISVTKPKSGTPPFSLKNPLRFLRQKPSPSPSTKHRVKLQGLQKPENRIGGMNPCTRRNRSKLILSCSRFGPCRSGPKPTPDECRRRPCVRDCIRKCSFPVVAASDECQLLPLVALDNLPTLVFVTSCSANFLCTVTFSWPLNEGLHYVLPSIDLSHKFTPVHR